MLYWTVVFFVCALLAAFFGFGAAVGIAKVLFFLFLALGFMAMVAGRQPG